MFIIIAIRAFYIQIIQNKLYCKLQEKQTTKIIQAANKRGDIYDANDIYIAIDSEAKKISINKLKYTEYTKNILKNELNFSDEDILNKIINKKDSNIIKLGTHFINNIENFSKSIRNDSIIIEDDYKRNYPWDETSSAVLGATGFDNIGLEGLEYLYNKKLGENRLGKYIQLRDGRGRTYKKKYVGEYGMNANLKLNIDIILSHLIQNKLISHLKNNKLSTMFTSVVDIDTNKLLSEISLPSYNPNDTYTYGIEVMADRNVRQVFYPKESLDVMLYLVNGYISADDLLFYKSNNKYKLIDSNETIKKILNNNKNFTKIILNKGFDHDILGEKVNIDYSGQDKGYFPNADELNDIIKENNIFGDYVICNSLHLSRLYTMAFFKYPIEPKIIYNDNDDINSKQNINSENILLYVNGPSHLGTDNLINNNIKNNIKLVIGWFYCENKKILLTVGAEENDSINNVDILSIWINIKEEILKYEYIKYKFLYRNILFTGEARKKVEELDKEYINIKNELISNYQEEF
jgi:hypothetical protein